MRHRSIIFFVTTYLMCSTLGVFCSSTCQAEQNNESSEPIKVVYRPPSSQAIPPIGSLMRFEIELVNTFDIETKIRLVGAKDGRFIDIAFPRGALNAVDRPTFAIEIPSPVAAMAYQFVIHQRDGTLTSTEKFTLKRNCIQSFKVSVPEDSPNSEFRRDVSTLVGKAKLLERETSSLESSLKLIEDIKTSLAN